MGSNVETTQSAAPALLALSAQSTLVQITLCSVGTSSDGMTPAPRVQPVEPVAGNPHGGFCEGGQAQAASTASPVPTHHEIDWELLMRAVRHHTDCAWVLLYIERWLQAPVRMPDGALVKREKGTPQGSVVSPILANLFLHYTFDMWMQREFPACPFERYADDAIIHCGSEEQARKLLARLQQRFAECRLELHPQKTKIVYRSEERRVGKECRSRWSPY